MTASDASPPPRIRPIERDRATPEQRRVGDTIFGSRNEDYGGPSAILLHLPELAERFDRLRDALVREQQLPKPMLHLAALVTARFWSAQYAWWKRVELCLAAGISQDVIDAVRERRRPVLADPAMAAVFEYVTELLERRRVSDATHARLRAIVGDEPIIELVMIVGFYSMLGLVCDAFEPAFPAGVPEPLDV
ncbi:MAG: 4-carboxymuconolactone decarboxylase [Chloroflexota bacterium]|jgi:4-carboxymuconolactone decarboxylase|nr:4-carboxymuconolactone decarboxylase [Chloroflexota bacterium]